MSLRIPIFLGNDIRSLVAWGTVCKRSREHYKKIEAYIHVAYLILKKGEVLATNLDTRCLWNALRESRVFLLGESHTSLFDRELLGKCTELLWTTLPFRLYTEAPCNSGKGQLEFVPHKIAQKSEHWDVSNQYKHCIVKIHSLFSKFICLGVMLLLKLVDAQDEKTFSCTFEALCQNPLFVSFTAFSKVKDRGSVLGTLLRYALRKVQDCIHHFEADCRKREKILVRLIEAEPEKKGVIAFLGASHARKETLAVQELIRKEIPFIAITSKRTAWSTHRLVGYQPPSPNIHYEGKRTICQLKVPMIYPCVLTLVEVLEHEISLLEKGGSALPPDDHKGDNSNNDHEGPN